MKPIGAILLVVLTCVGSVRNAQAAGPPPNQQVEQLVDGLVDVSEPGFGYSTLFSGSQFLLSPDSDSVHSLVLGGPRPVRSTVLASLVREGVAAVPSLLDHLDDGRKAKLPPLQGMMWIEFSDEYDFNRRTRKEPPRGVNRHALNEEHPHSHAITVGDLCFVALGQIVNRNFNASRYQASGGLIINSPSYSLRLRDVIRRDFEGLTAAKHRALLVQDFSLPDHEERRIGAYRRLAVYYPAVVEGLVLKQLSVPTYDVFAIESLAREQLYREPSPARRKELFDRFIRERGRASADGLLLQLFDDLDSQEAADEGRLHPAPTERFDARNILIQLYGFGKGVRSDQRPYVSKWAETERARFIEALVHDKSRAIDDVVFGIFSRAGDDDYLALACIHRLLGRGHDEPIRRHCEQRLGKDELYTEEIRSVLDRLKVPARK